MPVMRVRLNTAPLPRLGKSVNEEVTRSNATVCLGDVETLTTLCVMRIICMTMTAAALPVSLSHTVQR